MNTVLLIFFGGIYALFLAGTAIDAATRKAPWIEFVAAAAFGAATVGGTAWLVHAGLSWLSQHPWGWLLLIGFIAVTFCVWFVVGVIGLLVRLLYRP